jgi:hypothetical protein
VLGIFFKSVTNFIIPVRLSSDKSKKFENVSVADIMLSNTKFILIQFSRFIPGLAYIKYVHSQQIKKQESKKIRV